MNGRGSDRAATRGRALADLFHPPAEGFFQAFPVAADAVPTTARQLLAHTSHMTVAMERFHGGPVDLRVVRRTDRAPDRYAREILLQLPDGRVVQHGVVRIDLDRLPPAVASDIRRESTPLGRILLDAGLLCEVHDVQLLRILAGPQLAALLQTVPGAETYGRVASIAVDGDPVIELLEIVAPPSR